MAYTTTEAESRIDTVISKVKKTKNRVALTKRGKPVVAVVPIEDLEYLEALDAKEDAEDIQACKVTLKKKKDALIPWETVKKELGYD